VRIDQVAGRDVVTEDLLIDVAGTLEKQLWMERRCAGSCAAGARSCAAGARSCAAGVRRLRSANGEARRPGPVSAASPPDRSALLPMRKGPVNHVERCGHMLTRIDVRSNGAKHPSGTRPARVLRAFGRRDWSSDGREMGP
jgi:hypothetical protein